MTLTNCSKCNHKVVLINSCLCPLCGGLGVARMLTDSFDHANKEFPKLINKLNIIQHGSNLPNSDIRFTTIVKLRETSIWTAFQIKFVPSLIMKSDSPIHVYLQSINKNIKYDDITQLVSNFDSINRASFLTMFLFHIEVFLNGINSILKTKCDSSNYKALAKHVLKNLNIPDPKKEKFDILNVPALVRNCLHAEGKHKKEDTDGSIEGVFFKFVKGKTHSYGSWEHTCFFCDKLIDVFEEILKCSIIKKLQSQDN